MAEYVSESISLRMTQMADEILTLRAKLAEIDARCDGVRGGCPNGYDLGENCGCLLCEVRAIMRGEGDRPAVAEQMLADVKREHAAAWAAANRPTLGPVECKHSPEWHAGLTWCNNCQPRCAANGCTNRATSARNSAVPGWPDELACGQHGEEGDR